MSKKIIIDGNFPGETRVVLLSNNNTIEDIEYETSGRQQIKGNIYLAKITRVEPSLQAAFIDYGHDKSGFLPFTEIHPDYYHIPVSDQKSPISNFKEFAPPKITSADLAEKAQVGTNYNSLIDSEEIDIKAIEKLLDEKIPADFDLDVAESDIEHFSSSRNDITTQQKNYRIQEVMKKGQIILVQATKEERGNKGASFTSFISLAGKYCVLMPNKSSQNGVSRKISNLEERKRMRNLISQLNLDNDKNNASVIARTAATGRTTLELKRDYDYLVRLWNKIREATLKATAPCFIHEEEGIIQKTIRDMFDYSVKELIVQGGAAYQSALKFLRDILPTETGRLKEYKNTSPIFTKLAIEDQLSTLYQPIVPLSSGGYIVINPTEALISIDVNSGKATSERNIEETALKTNLEAAKEIARQIKLRDLSGLIVIDFIDMYESRNRKIIERSIRECLSRDRARIQTANISIFGLFEMSRQRLRPSFLESNSTICSHCNGKGIVRANESNAMLILRTVENEIATDNNVDIVNVYAAMSSVVYLLNNKRSEIALIENKYKIKLNFNFDPNATSDSYSIEKIKLPKKPNNSNSISKPALQDISDIYNDEESSTKIFSPAGASSSSNNRNKQKWKTTQTGTRKPSGPRPDNKKKEAEENSIEQDAIQTPDKNNKALIATPTKIQNSPPPEPLNEDKSEGAVEGTAAVNAPVRRKRNNKRPRRPISKSAVKETPEG